MAEDFISKLAHNKNKRRDIHNQINENTSPTKSPKNRIKKTIAVDLPIYTKLKIISAKKNVQIKQLVKLALNYAFEHNIYHEN